MLGTLPSRGERGLYKAVVESVDAASRQLGIRKFRHSLRLVDLLRRLRASFREALSSQRRETDMDNKKLREF